MKSEPAEADHNAEIEQATAEMAVKSADTPRSGRSAVRLAAVVAAVHAHRRRSLTTQHNS